MVTDSFQTVEKWGQRSLVTQAMLDDVGEQVVKDLLVARCQAAAEDDGWTMLPDSGEVELFHSDDPRFLWDDDSIPEGALLAITTIRCVPTN